MITFIAFSLTILGCVNWLMIGLLQYDFIAGLFGFQASMFSRIVYIIFGVAASYLVLRVIVNKGTFKVWEKKKKGSRATLNESQEIQAQQQPAQMQPAYANVEAGQEQIPQQQEVSKQKPPKKKKWWQFWKCNGKKKKQKENFSDEKTPHLPSQGETSSTDGNLSENNMPTMDIDISLNTTPKHFNEQPTLERQPSQDNLFDEHLTH